VNALHQAQNAYRTQATALKTTRSVEYDTFARITHRLKRAASGGKTTIKELIAAVHDNRRLWTTLAADVAGEGNALPQDLRARILYLSEFTRSYSTRVLNGASPDPLIDVNTAVMRGLRAGGSKGKERST
jgi:flagellar protein FlaF